MRRVLAVLAAGVLMATATVVTGSAQIGSPPPLDCRLVSTSAANPGGAPGIVGAAADQGGEVHVISQAPSTLHRFASNGVRTQQIDLGPGLPIDIEADAAGSTYVVVGDIAGAELRRYAPDGVLDLTIASGGGSPGFSNVAASADGTIFATTGLARLVERFDAAGLPLPTFGAGGPAQITDLATDVAGGLYVVSIGPGLLERYDPAGVITLSRPLPGVPQAVAVDGAGMIHVYTLGEVWVFGPDGTELTRLAGPRPEGAPGRDLAIASDGAILFSDYTELFRYADLTASPEVVPLAVGEGISELGGVGWNPLGDDLLALDAASDNLYRLSGDGILTNRLDLAALAPPITGATGIAVSADAVWVLAGSSVTPLGPLTGEPLAALGPAIALPAAGISIQGDPALVLDSSGGVTRVTADGSAVPLGAGLGALVAVAGDPGFPAAYGVDAQGQVFRLDPAGPVRLFGAEAYPAVPIEITGLHAANGSIWVADGGGASVHVFDAAGNLRGSLGAGSAIPNIVRPTYLSSKAAGQFRDVIVGDRATNRLHWFSCEDTALVPLAPVVPTPLPIGGPRFTG